MSDAPGPGQAGPQTQLPEAPRPPLPPTAPERGGPRARLLGIAGLVLTVLFLPAGLVLSIAAVVTGVRSRKRARRVLAPAPGAVAGVVMGTIGLVVCLSQIGLYAVMWDDFNGYVKCRESALTFDDKKTCQDQWLPRIERRLHLPKDSLRQHPSWY
ncbi:DUF4190 domain-containing protein [Actinoallomurus rhizosphaericola]|uniref:DUF4190 domain-containing protein n=1 Tax=Actinoallomurus rhizosphaericola TaxID=2952536 RepID=UPI0020932EDD|nr:DUF4190 domain-containing protein [Actinoallomurus rhizosphaericola]MCO5999190.1 DUF4190 domain-containing protein [Actinoallomurus rhizosphaericola]